MPKRKRQSKRKLVGKGRTKDAARWIEADGCRGKPLAETYAKRYGVSEQTARLELMEIGYYDANKMPGAYF